RHCKYKGASQHNDVGNLGLEHKGRQHKQEQSDCKTNCQRNNQTLIKDPLGAFTSYITLPYRKVKNACEGYGSGKRKESIISAVVVETENETYEKLNNSTYYKGCED